MEIPKMKEWESPSGWCRRLAHLYGMNETQAEVLEEVRRVSYIQGVNDILERKSLTPDPSKEASPPDPSPRGEGSEYIYEANEGDKVTNPITRSLSPRGRKAEAVPLPTPSPGERGVKT